MPFSSWPPNPLLIPKEQKHWTQVVRTPNPLGSPFHIKIPQQVHLFLWAHLPSGEEGSRWASSSTWFTEQVGLPEAQTRLLPPSLPVPYVQIGLTSQFSLVLQSSHYQRVHSTLNFHTIWLSPLAHMLLSRSLTRTQGTSNPYLTKNLTMKRLKAYTSSLEQLFYQWGNPNYNKNI